jgi:predicted anti-sigma-YlaC factor YlaD
MKPLVVCLIAALATGCAVKKFAINKLGDSLANSGTTFASDDDPEFVASATPFSLKLIESLLGESPRHRGLLLAAASGFTQYGYAFIQQPAEELEDQDVAKAAAMKGRARRMFLRARNYGLRGLTVRHPDFEKRLRADAKAAVGEAGKAEAALLYWTAAAWGSAITLSKDDPETVADQPLAEALIDRALELDEGFDHGAIHSFLITYEPARPGGEAGAAERARKHFERAVELSEGRLASPYVSLAEAVSVAKQDRREFEALLNKALAIDADAKPEWRLSNTVMQRRARWLLGREDRLFVEPLEGGGAPTAQQQSAEGPATR